MTWRLATGSLPRVAASRRLDTSSFRGVDAQPIEEARINQRAVAVIGLVGNDEHRGIGAKRTDHGSIAEAIGIGKIEIALVVSRAAKDGAGAVIHQHEIGDIDRQKPIGIEGMAHLEARCRSPFFSAVSMAASDVPLR